MSVAVASVEKINALKTGIEATTGESYNDLTEAVQGLKNGYGQSGGGSGENNQFIDFLNKTLTSLDTTGVTSGKIYQRAFFEHSQLKTANLINIKEIESAGFYGCTALETVSFPNIEVLKESAFENCGLIELTLPTSLKSFGTAAFGSNRKLRKVEITTLPTAFATSAFQDCDAIETFIIPENWNLSINLYAKAITQESLHGMIENFADLTGLTAKTFKVGGTNLAKIDEDHIAMLEAKNWTYS